MKCVTKSTMRKLADMYPCKCFTVKIDADGFELIGRLDSEKNYRTYKDKHVVLWNDFLQQGETDVLAYLNDLDSRSETVAPGNGIERFVNVTDNLMGIDSLEFIEMLPYFNVGVFSLFIQDEEY